MAATTTPLDVLRSLQDIDPDGWEHVQPTAAHRQAFRAAALATYGPQAWADYCAGGWEPAREV